MVYLHTLNSTDTHTNMCLLDHTYIIGTIPNTQCDMTCTSLHQLSYLKSVFTNFYMSANFYKILALLVIIV